MNSIKFNGKEVKNPFARRAIIVVGTIISLGAVALVLFAALPFVGLVLTGVMAIVFLIVFIIVFFAALKNISTGSKIDIGSYIED